MNHAKPETPLERADRLIAELADDGERQGLHRTDMAYVEINMDSTAFNEALANAYINTRVAFA